jgi:hypothetical protein
LEEAHGVIVIWDGAPTNPDVAVSAAARRTISMNNSRQASNNAPLATMSWRRRAGLVFRAFDSIKAVIGRFYEEA